MTVKAMSAGQIQAFTKACEEQNIGVTRTKKGLFLRFPDGSSTVQHFTTSDVKATQNQIARFRRAGVVHPDDPRHGGNKIPAYIKDRPVSEQTIRSVREYVKERDYPEVVYSPDLVSRFGWDPGFANRALYHSGFTMGPAGKNRKIARPWYTPDDLLAQKDNPAATPADVARKMVKRTQPDTTISPEAEERRQKVEVVETPVVEEPTLVHDPVIDESEVPQIQPLHPEPEEETPHVDFIDERDSWVVDMDELLGSHLSRMVADRLSVLKAVGLDYEIRVWKK